MKKNRKGYYILAPIMVFVMGLIIVKAFGVSYSASNTVYYHYIRRNMMSHHFISANGSNASGTILVKSGSASSETSGTPALTYCAQRGKKIQGGDYEKVNMSELGSRFSKSQQKKMKAALMNSYPFISISTLKSRLKDPSYGMSAANYTKYKFDTLDVQEAMTAAQATVWNIIENTTSHKYKETRSIPSGQSSYKYFGSINWEKTSSYNITGRGKKSTILQEGDTATSAGSYKKPSSDSMLDDRINALITWLLNLPSEAVQVNDIVPTFNYKDVTWDYSPTGSTLEVTVYAETGSDFNYASDEYAIEFTDLTGAKITSVTSTAIKTGGVTTGYKYNLTGVMTKGVKATIDGTKKDVASDVYVYKHRSGYSYSQSFIGVDDGDQEFSKELNILLDGSGQINAFKFGPNGQTAVTYHPAGTAWSTQYSCDSATNPCLEGAYMALYAADGKTVIRSFVTSNEAPIIITGLPDGTYYLKEITPPVGYIGSTETLTIVITDGNMANAAFKNTYTRICFDKVSTKDGKTIDGAVLRIEDAYGSSYEVFTSSSQQGKYCIEGQLESGYYYLVEVEAPRNFIKTDKVYKFKVGVFDEEAIVEDRDDAEIVYIDSSSGTVTIQNEPGITITKTDLSTGGCVEGAKLTVKDDTGKVVDEWTSSCVTGEDKHQVGLDPGKYTLIETIAPAGYATTESIEFTIDSNGNVDKSLDMKDAPIEVCILKVSTDSEEGLPDAEFDIYDSKGNLYQKFVTDYLATCFPYMPVGKYTLKETKAPEGYQLLEDVIEIEVKDTSKIQMFEVENKIEVVKTSMDASRIVTIVATVFAICGFGLVGYYARKRKAY